ncbi:hypothetical protein ABPG75_004101 [Micractinium tetrahymenae]
MLRLAGVALLGAVLIALLRSPRAPSDSEDALAASAPPPELPADVAAAAPGRLAKALSFPTLASADAPKNHVRNPAPFQQLHRHLEASFPTVYKRLRHERASLQGVNDFSILFTWPGSNRELRPVLIMSHMDVVPAPEGPAYNWTHPPFGGVVADGYIWGRGALDVKVSLLQQLEAVSLLLDQGFQPKRTIHFAVGHDEEQGGAYGARAIAALLRSRGVELEIVLDEGGIILMDGLKAGAHQVVASPIALVGTSEKGYETWDIEVEGSGGHSSMPPTDGFSVAARIARILATLDASPPTTRLGEPTTDFLKGLAPAVALAPARLALRHADNWVLNPVLGQLLGQASPEVASFVRTTCSVVGVQAGGIAENVLPNVGTITLNFRTLPGQNSTFVREYLQMVTRKEAAHVTLQPRGRTDPAAPVAPSRGPHWRLLKQVILQTLRPQEGLLVVPYLVGGMTDSRHYNELAGGRVYRFCPHRYALGDIKRVHGVDERIAVDDYLRGIGFYARFLEAASSDEGSEEAAAEAAAGGSSAAATE